MATEADSKQDACCRCGSSEPERYEHPFVFYDVESRSTTQDNISWKMTWTSSKISDPIPGRLSLCVSCLLEMERRACWFGTILGVVVALPLLAMLLVFLFLAPAQAMVPERGFPYGVFLIGLCVTGVGAAAFYIFRKWRAVRRFGESPSALVARLMREDEDPFHSAILRWASESLNAERREPRIYLLQAAQRRAGELQRNGACPEFEWKHLTKSRP